MRKLRILALMHEDLVPPDDIESRSDEEVSTWKTEYDVITGLKELGHDTRSLGVRSDLGIVQDAILEWKPHLAFNLLEEFHGVAVYDQHVISYLELMQQPYTGCNPRGLLLCHDKALSKKILSYHRVKVPKFAVFPRGRPVRSAGSRLRYPLFVKSLIEEGSYGIAQASLVHSEDKLKQRVEFLHEQMGTHAIAEEYVEGRELYVGVLGNRRLMALPILELRATKLPDGAPLIATRRLKWNWEYQKKHGIETIVVRDLPPGSEERIQRLAKRIYRILTISGYARIDLRLTPEGELYVLEANPNADLACDEEFSMAAEAADITYERLLQRIVNLGLNYQAEWRLVD